MIGPSGKETVIPPHDANLDQEAEMDDKVNLAEKLASFEEAFTPKIIGALNEYKLEVVKARGEFVWHKHDDTDDFFLVLKGGLTIQLRDRASGEKEAFRPAYQHTRSGRGAKAGTGRLARGLARGEGQAEKRAGSEQVVTATPHTVESLA
jgi:hypothetical protein